MHAVSVLAQWSSRLSVEVPTVLLDWLKKAFTLKTSTSLVRHAYLQAMLGAFKGQSDEMSCYVSDIRAHIPKRSAPTIWLFSGVQVTLCPRLQTSCLCCSKPWRRLQHKTPSMLCLQKVWQLLCF